MACLLVVITMSGCPDIKVDPGEVGGGPTVEFDPARSQATKARFIPFPNDLARDPATGKIALPEQACESMTSKITREQVLNKLDGFGTYETAMQVSFTDEVDEASLADHIVMYQLTKQGTPVSPAGATPIKITVVKVGKTERVASGGCDVARDLVNVITFVPNAPLEQKSTYFVALLKGIKSKSGEEFSPSYTWGLVASPETPVTLDDQGNIVSDRTPLEPADPEQRAQLIALAGIWKLHEPGLTFLDQAMSKPRTDYLVGFQFTTQTVTNPLDPMVAGSPASKLSTVGILQAASVTGKFGPYSALCTDAGETSATCFMKLALGGCSPLTTGCGTNNYAAGSTACGLYGCAAIGDIIGGGIFNINYQTQVPNSYDMAKPIQGAWSDPVNPEQQAPVALETIIVVPAGNPPMNNGWPTVVYAHGLGSSKESVFAIAGRLAAAGFATVAIDTSAHGSRAVRISNDINLGCSGMCFSGTTPTGTHCDVSTQCESGQTCGSLAASPSLVPPSPTTAPQCYAPFLSPDLAAMRDGIRQTVLDHQRVIKAIKTCTSASACGGALINPDKIYFLGMSLGGIIGSMSAGLAPEIKTTVLDVPGVGWADSLENTETLQIRCSLVNGLIDAGVLSGEKWTGGSTGLCTTDAWKEQPGYATFAAIGRWVLDPADGANFSPRLAAKHVLVQEVVGDTVVPNVATDRLAALLGLIGMPLANDPWNGTPSAAITTTPTANKFVKYTSDATNVFVHSSLLRPAPTTDPTHGVNGTLRLQVDAATFFSLNQ
ncbi:MAG TPA: hypothetical protein VIV40_10745 [Kofleriaceae bacterium]